MENPIQQLEKKNTSTALLQTTSGSSVILVPVEQEKIFKWMVAKLEDKQFAELANRVPDSVEKCMKAPSVHTLMKAVGRDCSREFLSARILWLIAQMNVAHTMTTPQKNFAIDTLLDRYPHETLADFSLVFRRMAQGYYGPSYHQLDTSTIMTCMAVHIEEKAMFLERDQTTAKEEAKKEETQIDYKAYILRRQQQEEKAKQEKQNELNKRREEVKSFMESQTPAQLQREELMNQWLVEVMDEKKSNTKKFVAKKGSPSFNDWLKQRQQNQANRNQVI